jgi:hypothetical protein
MNTLFISFLLLTSLTGCTSIDLAPSLPEKRVTGDRDYISTIHSNSSADVDYSGFENSFEFRATLQSSAVRQAVLNKLAEYYQWDSARMATEREKAFHENASESQVFLSFFTPNRSNDNLSEAKPIWTVILEAGGQKFYGKAKKVKSLLAEIQSLYPYHTRWNTAYTLVFPVAANNIEGLSPKLTITGPLGTKTVEFKSEKSSKN